MSCNFCSPNLVWWLFGSILCFLFITKVFQFMMTKCNYKKYDALNDRTKDKVIQHIFSVIYRICLLVLISVIGSFGFEFNNCDQLYLYQTVCIILSSAMIYDLIGFGLNLPIILWLHHIAVLFITASVLDSESEYFQNMRRDKWYLTIVWFIGFGASLISLHYSAMTWYHFATLKLKVKLIYFGFWVHTIVLILFWTILPIYYLIIGWNDTMIEETKIIGTTVIIANILVEIQITYLCWVIYKKKAKELKSLSDNEKENNDNNNTLVNSDDIA
eukprot:426608_1